MRRIGISGNYININHSFYESIWSKNIEWAKAYPNAVATSFLFSTNKEKIKKLKKNRA